MGWGGSNILYLSKEGLEKIAEKVNPFWKDVFFNLSELKQEKAEVSIYVEWHLEY
jgi:ribosomal protein L18E